MTREIPASRDERIALAGASILACLAPDDQLDPEHYRVFKFDALIEFRVLVTTMPRAIALNHRIADAILLDAGFTAISYLPPVAVAGGYRCAIRVPVGAP
jgi:hypothetical protein